MDMSSLVSILVALIIAGGIVWLLWWLIGYIGLPEPFNKIARVIIAVVAVVFCINLLLSLGGGQPFIRWK
jgi:hypothetical protein